MRVLILDNYDSFSYNLYQRVGELGAHVTVARNDAISLPDIEALAPERILLSPGPGRPDRPGCFGVCEAVIRHLGPRLPILGICLGHQGIVTAHGGRLIAAPRPVHGQASAVYHQGDSVLFRHLPLCFEAMRYHSLVADPARLPPGLRVTARTAAGLVMAVEHRHHPVYGVQFHPESIGTPIGEKILANFLVAAAPSAQPSLPLPFSTPARVLVSEP